MNKNKNIIKRGISGAIIGVFIMTCIILLISAKFGQGQYLAVAPTLIEDMGNEFNAVFVQYIVSMAYGVMWSISSLIWEKEDWSHIKMTIVHFFITTTITYPVAYYMRWMNRSISGFVSYFGLFVIIYFIIWLIGYFKAKKDVREFNSKISGYTE